MRLLRSTASFMIRMPQRSFSICRSIKLLSPLWGPQLKPRRFSVSYHLLGLRAGAPRVRLQVWVDENEQVPSLVGVWPTADWHEREAFDMMGLRFDGHPNQRRILMDDDWEGHPLRKDYPIGGEPVRFSGES